MALENDIPYKTLDEPMKMMPLNSSVSSLEGDVAPATVNFSSNDEGRVNIIPPRTTPKDRFNIVYMIVYLLGIGALLPWNFFITVTQYFNYKYRNVSLPMNMSMDSRYETHMQVTFESSIVLANQIPSIFFLIAMIVFLRRFSTKSRIITSIIVTFVMFAGTAALVKVNTDDWQDAFFAITLASVVVVSGASAVWTSSLFGWAATFPQKYTQAIMGGICLSGVVSAIANIVTLAAGADVVESAFWYFVIAEGFVLASLFGYLCIEKTEFAMFYKEQFDRSLVETAEKKRALAETESGRDKVRRYLATLRQISVWAVTVVLGYLVTLSVYPSITARVHSVNEESKSIWTTTYFVPVYCFLLFNVSDLVGRTVAGWYILPKAGVVIPTLAVLRIAFIPLFMVCNVLPRNGLLKLVLDSDVYPVVLIALFALTHGYVCTVAMMLSLSSVKKDQSETVGTAMSFMMSAGLTLGSSLSYLLIEVV